jgi:3-hydroxyisobutyrate dehydrogenase-like beta-hydroxyacid dehydrogenase
MLKMNQANVDEMLLVARDMGLDIRGLVDVLQSGTANSRALEHVSRGIDSETAEHLSKLQLIDMDLYAAAIQAAGLDDRGVTPRAVTGAKALVSSAAIYAAANHG